GGVLEARDGRAPGVGLRALEVVEVRRREALEIPQPELRSETADERTAEARQGTRDLWREDRAEGRDRQQERRRERTSGTTPRTERERREQQRQRKEERPREREREQHRLHGHDALAPDGAADGGKEQRIARKAQRLGHERLARSRPREFAAFDQAPREREVLDLVVAPWLRVGAERGGVRRGEGDREERERGDGQVRARGPRRGQPRPSRIEQPSWPRIG